MGPMLIFDKSALQSFSLDEAVWLDQFFMANITPLLYVETLADITKATDKKGRSGEQIVSELSRKTPINASFPNIHHHNLLVQDLLGNTVQMTNRPIVPAGLPKKDPDGKIGFHFDEFPEQAAMQRWFDGEFNEIERYAAQSWREALSSIDFDTVIGWVKNTVPQGTRLSTMADVKQFTDKFVEQSGVAILEFALQLLGVPEAAKPAIRARYKHLGEPSIAKFAPYATYVLKVEMFFYLCLDRSFISKDRPSNKADIAYLYYLPFCSAFVSGDNLHARTAELFMEHGQKFVPATALKAALKEFDTHYSQFADEIEKVGIMGYAGYPPAELKNAATDLWDEFCISDWREVDEKRKADSDGMPSDPELGKKLSEWHEKSVPTAPPIDPDSVDFVTISRKHSIRKGKWRILPPELEKESS